MTCQGQVIGAILADTKSHAQRAAKAVKVTYEELEPIITIPVYSVDFVFSRSYCCMQYGRLLSQCSTVVSVRHASADCCKGDERFQWEMLFFGV